MLVKLELKHIDGKTVLCTPSGEPTTIEEALRAFSIKDGECLPMTISITNEEISDLHVITKHAKFIKRLLKEHPDGIFKTDDGQSFKIHGANDSQKRQ